jgi:hypothetical protein
MNITQSVEASARNRKKTASLETGLCDGLTAFVYSLGAFDPNPVAAPRGSSILDPSGKGAIGISKVLPNIKYLQESF